MRVCGLMVGDLLSPHCVLVIQPSPAPSCLVPGAAWHRAPEQRVFFFFFSGKCRKQAWHSTGPVAPPFTGTSRRDLSQPCHTTTKKKHQQGGVNLSHLPHSTNHPHIRTSQKNTFSLSGRGLLHLHHHNLTYLPTLPLTLTSLLTHSDSNYENKNNLSSLSLPSDKQFLSQS